MRHKGSISQVNLERDKIIPVLFRQAKNTASWPTNTMRLCEVVASMPVPVFFIAPETAIYYARQRYFYNKYKTFKSKFKQTLYDAFYNNFVELMGAPDAKNQSIPMIVTKALRLSAPCTGLNPWQIYKVMLRHKKELKNRHLKKKP